MRGGGVLFAFCAIFGAVLTSAPAAAEKIGADAGAALEVLLQQGQAQERQIQQLEQQSTRSRAAQVPREQATARLAHEIDQLKNQPPGVARDLALSDKLAQAKAQADELAQAQANHRQLALLLNAQRRQLLSTCDHILEAAAKRDDALNAAQRFYWLGLRTAQVEALLSDGSYTAARELARSEMANGSDRVIGSTLDDPQALRERADLLRDSADKLRREVQRLQERGQELQRRQRLRERASRVDEDLFAEQSSSRRNAGSASSGAAGPLRAGSPTLASASAVDAAVPSMTATATTPRTGPNPATLDGLLRVEGPFDVGSKLQALARAQAELETIATDLLRRATALDERALRLSRQK